MTKLSSNLRALYINLGKKSGVRKEEKAAEDQPKQPLKTGTEQKAVGDVQAGPSHKQQLQAGGGEPGPSESQGMKKKKQQQAQPALPPQMVKVGGGDTGQLQQRKEQMQQKKQQPHGFDRGQKQPDGGRAGIITYCVTNLLTKWSSLS